MGTYWIQTTFWCKHCANLLKKFQKILKKHECTYELTSFIYKISWSNSSYSSSYKKTKFLTNSKSSNAPKFIFFVTVRVRWIWPWNFVHRRGKLRCTFIFFQKFFKLFSRFAWGLHQNMVCIWYVPFMYRGQDIENVVWEEENIDERIF
jgi:hypothetical protein